MSSRRPFLFFLLVLLAGLACAKPQVKKPDPVPDTPAASVKPAGDGYLGVTFYPGFQGLRIVDVFRDSPAARAGLIKGDTLVSAEGQPIGGALSFRAKIRSMREGDRLRMRVVNVLGREREVTAIINEMPPGLTLYGQ